MDAILAGLTGNLPQLGVGGIICFIVGLLVKVLMDEKDKHAATRASVQAELDVQSARHRTELDAQLARLQQEMEQDVARYRQDCADAREALASERLRNTELIHVIDAERRARYEAERAVRGQLGDDPTQIIPQVSAPVPGRHRGETP